VTKCVRRLGSPQTHWGSFSAPPAPLGTIGEGVLLLRERERDMEGEGKGREEGKGLPPLYLTSGYGPELS